MKKVVLILAGGRGERLWPVSRVNFPKFFLKIKGNLSLIQDAVLRGKNIAGCKNVFVISNKNYRYQIKDHILEEIKNFSLENVLPEPVGRNTAPAIAFGVRFFLSKGIDPVVFVFPADHIIEDKEKFFECIKLAEKEAEKGFIVTVGIKPDYPATGYGYIKINQESKIKNQNLGAFKVEKFVEKPDLKRARKYVKSGNYYWNGGIFIAKASVFWNELKKYKAEIVKELEKWKGNEFKDLERIYKNLPDISFDYAVMEKTKIAKLIPYDGGWNDLGDWKSIFDIFKKDKKGNFFKGNVVELDSKNSFVFSINEKNIVLLGTSNIGVINTDDALLVLNPEYSQKVKEVIKKIKNKEVLINHKKVYRPWGWYKVLEHRDNYKVKIIEVYPGASLSLQKHLRRSEEWIVLKGKGEIELNGKIFLLKEGQRIKIPIRALHRLSNKTRRPLRVLEIARGKYIEEDDIIRFEDNYQRE